MRKFYLVFISIITVIVIAALTVYIKYEDVLLFAPHIFLTELLKFVFLTVIWTILVQLFNIYNTEIKKKNHLDILLLNNVRLVQIKINKGLNSKDLSQGISLILNNITTLKLLYNFSAMELNQLSSFEDKLNTSDYLDYIKDIEYLVDNNLTYLNTNPCNKIMNELNQLNYVFGNKN